MRHLKFWEQLMIRNLFILMEHEQVSYYKKLYKKCIMELTGSK